MEQDKANFRAAVYDYYREHGRPFPWRETQDPYRILVSEIMLQQTQTDRVAGKYDKFIARFPGFASLAAAPLPEVLALWSGLGYNRRALSLKKLAETVMEQYDGTLPSDPRRLLELPGIGSYTAAAIAAFAFNQPSVFIETNIRAVFIHFFFGDAEGVHDREIMPLVEQTLDKDDPRTWYYALMDYGVMLKKLHTNPSRRSAHHKKQSPFKGSNREVRGWILKALLSRPEMTVAELSEESGIDRARIGLNLAGLRKEGLVKENGERYSIA
ncbi:MAG: ArsR family transcriptional regulator [Nitrospirota bacterium]|nr:ArsR family transcriptional regulator [Nitrospirota bacterium]